MAPGKKGKEEKEAKPALHEAARKGDVVQIHKLLAEGKDVDGRDKFSRTPLHLAAYAGQVN